MNRDLGSSVRSTCWLLTLVMFCAATGHAKEAPCEALDAAARKLQSTDSATLAREQAEVFGRCYLSMVRQLIRALETARSDVAKAEVCFQLGQMRSAEAIQPLIDHIELEVPQMGDMVLEWPRWQTHPCMEALSHIGRPATQALVRALAFETKDSRRHLEVSALRWFAGKERTRSLLNEALQRAGKMERQRYAKALDELEHPKNTYELLRKN